MPSLNKVILIGNLCADPELKQTQNGAHVTSFSIGVQRRFKDANGQYNSDFISIVAWKQSAEFVVKYFKKGDAVTICGSLQTRNYTDNNGVKHYVTEVVADEIGFASSKKDSARSEAPAAAPVQPSAIVPPATTQDMNAFKFEEINGDEDLPF